MGGYINYYEIILSTNKSLLQASNNFRTPLRRRLRGVTERGFKGEADEDDLPKRPRAAEGSLDLHLGTEIQL